MTDPTIPPAPAPAAPPRTRRLLIIGATAAALVVGGITGGVIGAAVSTSQLQPQIDAAQAKIDDQASRLLFAEADVATAEKRRDDAEADYAAKAQELEAREAELAERESAVTAVEEQIAANSFGAGVRLVGTNTEAGTYTTGEITSGNCYYVWKTSTASDADIVDNNRVEAGTATVTLRDGEVFESRGCGTWTKQ